MNTKLDYIRFAQRFNDFFTREGVGRMSSAPSETEDSPEPYFSWRPCGCCGSSEGGNREDYVAYNMGEADDKRIEVSVCEDCVYFNEYSRLPDMEMMAVDADTVTVTLTDGREVALCGEVYGYVLDTSDGGSVNVFDVVLPEDTE